MNRFVMRACFGVLFLCASLSLIAGCARPIGSVSGTVTYQNKALKGGSVSFVSSEGRQSFSSEIKEDGTYSVDGITGGTYKVCVDTSGLKPPSDALGYKGSGGKGAPPAPGGKDNKKSAPPSDAVVPDGYKGSSPADAALAANAKKYVAIPESYKDAKTTELTIEIVGGAQTFNITLK